MEKISFDVNSRTVQCFCVSTGINVSSAGKIDIPEKTLVVRIHAMEESVIRVSGKSDAGVVLGEGETEYFGVTREGIDLVSGSINVMY